VLVVKKPEVTKGKLGGTKRSVNQPSLKLTSVQRKIELKMERCLRVCNMA